MPRGVGLRAVKHVVREGKCLKYTVINNAIRVIKIFVDNNTVLALECTTSSNGNNLSFFLSLSLSLRATNSRSSAVGLESDLVHGNVGQIISL